MKIKNILSLFDGKSGAMSALNKLNIYPENYYASEIDPYSEAVSKYHYPKIIRLGDVTKIEGKNLPEIDLFVAGFPCQAFSLAGKQLNFDDPRGKLFFEVVRLIKEVKPKYFLLENVKMKSNILEQINNYIGIKPVLINSSLLSAQNRERNYWCAKLNNNGEYEQIPIEQPINKGIYLKDVILKNIDPSKYKKLDSEITDYYLDKINKNQFNITGGGIRGRYLDDNGKRLDKTVESQSGLTTQRLELREDGKSNCLTSVQKDHVCVQIGKTDNNKGFEQTKRVYSTNGKSPCLVTVGGGNQEAKISEDLINWRKLTPIECERLQTYEDNYTLKGIMNDKEVIISDSRRYKMLGNGFTRDVIAHILKQMIEK